MDETFKAIYYNPQHPASFGSVYNLYKAAKKKDKTVRLKDVKRWLSAQEPYIIHNKIVRKFQTRKTIASGIDEYWQADLAIFEALARYNKGFKYLLVNIDVFSRQATVIPLKKKNAETMVQAYKKLFKKKIPRNLQSDLGTEFWNAPLRKLFKENEVNFYSVSSDQKASIAERFIRSFKDKMFRYFTHNNTLSYISVLNSLVTSYNNKPHRSLHGLAPNMVTEDNEREVWEKQYGGYVRSQHQKSKFRIGDKVAITKLKRTFKKGYLPGWSKERFKIVDKINSVPPVWKIADNNGDIIEGIFYDQELQKVA